MENDKLTEVADIVRFIKAQGMKWLGHIQRVDKTRPARGLLDWKPTGTRPVGRPKQRWQEDVVEDLKKLKIKTWKETAKDRRTWKGLAEKAKTLKCVEVTNGDDNGRRVPHMKIFTIIIIIIIITCQGHFHKYEDLDKENIKLQDLNIF
jgi:hypothetical protein